MSVFDSLMGMGVNKNQDTLSDSLTWSENERLPYEEDSFLHLDVGSMPIDLNEIKEQKSAVSTWHAIPMRWL